MFATTSVKACSSILYLPCVEKNPVFSMTIDGFKNFEQKSLEVFTGSGACTKSRFELMNLAT